MLIQLILDYLSTYLSSLSPIRLCLSSTCVNFSVKNITYEVTETSDSARWLLVARASYLLRAGYLLRALVT